MSMWKNDNFFIGALMALLLSLAAALIVVAVAPPLYRQFSELMPHNKLLLLAFLPALLLMRYYMKKLRFEKAGMGALTMIFMLIIFYFIFFDKNTFSIFFLNI